jgi:RNA polymerase sigma-70 factor (ECF subfamily)
MKVKDEELFIFKQLIAGNSEAFRFFFEKYYPDLCNFVNIYVHDPVVSEEIVQDIFIYFWEKREEITIDTSVRSYLYRASKNKSLNYIRNEKTKLSIFARLSDPDYSNADMPDHIIDANQLREVINRAIDSLPERCREVYILGKEKNLSYREISEEMRISVKTVEVQMGKALKTLRGQLKPYYKDIFLLFLMMR